MLFRSASGELKSLSNSGQINLQWPGNVEIQGTVSANGDVLLTALSENLRVNPISRIDGAGVITLSAGNNLTIDGPIGSIVAPHDLELTATDGSLIVTSESGRLAALQSVKIEASSVEFHGILETTQLTSAADDFELDITGGNVVLTGSITSVGSLRVTTPGDVDIHNFTGNLTSTVSNLRISAGGDVNAGRLTLNSKNKWIAEPVLLQAGREITIVSPDGKISVSTSSGLAVFADTSHITLSARDISVVGGI